jgi:hypothetical protein
VSIQIFYSPLCLQELRDYLLYILDSNYEDLAALWKQRKKGPLSLLDYLNMKVQRDVQSDQVEMAKQEGVMRFHGNFECSNIEKVLTIEDGIEYDMYLRVDTNTNRHLRWFYFGISGLKPNSVFKINIRNMVRNTPFFSYGMKIAVRIGQQWTSEGIFDVHIKKNEEEHRVVYVAKGPNKKYYLPKPGEESDDDTASNAECELSPGKPCKRNTKPFYTLTFSFATPSVELLNQQTNQVYFAFCQPYGFTDLIKFIKQLEAKLETRRSDDSNNQQQKQLCGESSNYSVITNDCISYCRTKIGHTYRGSLCIC